MKLRFASWLSVLALLGLSFFTGCSKTNTLAPNDGITKTSAGSQALSTQRPLSDFLSAQGSTSLFFPPFGDYIAWTNNDPQTLFAAIDYAGISAAYLATHGGPVIPTQVTGNVSERPLADGRAEVTVNLFTKNAITWAVGLPGDIFADPPLFGYRQGDLLANPSLKPALSNSEFHVTFTNDAPGAPLPDVTNAFIVGNATPGQTLLTLSFRSTGTGPLRAAFGVADGTPGRCEVSNSGILHSSSTQGALADGFPAEVVNLGKVGGGALSRRGNGD